MRTAQFTQLLVLDIGGRRSASAERRKPRFMGDVFLLGTAVLGRTPDNMQRRAALRAIVPEMHGPCEIIVPPDIHAVFELG